MFGVVPISGFSIHPSKITTVIIVIAHERDEKNFQAEIKGRRWSYVWDTTKFEDGEYKISVFAYDIENNSSSDSVSVNLNNSLLKKGIELLDKISKGQIPFDISFSTFVIPFEGQVVGKTFPVIGISFHPSPITHLNLELKRGDKKRDFALPATYFWYSVVSADDFEDGEITLSVYATDKNGVQSSSSITAVIQSFLSGITIPFPQFELSPTQVVYQPYPVYVTSATYVAIVNPQDGNTINRFFCSALCYIYGYYFSPQSITSGYALITSADNQTLTKQGEIYRSSFLSSFTLPTSEFPDFGTFVVRDWWNSVPSGKIILKFRVIDKNGKESESEAIDINLQ